MKYKLLILFLSLTFGQSFKDLTERPTYFPNKTTSKIVIDGVFSEID